MPLVLTSKQAAYGDDVQSLSKETMQLVQRIQNNVTAFQTLITEVTNDSDMTQAEVDEITTKLNQGYTYLWNQITSIIPPEYQV